MTDAIEFGPEIKLGSPLWPEGQERPVWLADDVQCARNYATARDPWNPAWVGFPNAWSIQWTSGIAIKLPISHPASIAQRWNDDNPDEKPFTVPHFGSEVAPADWDGGEVLLRCGEIGRGEIWHHHTLSVGQIIAYRSKPSEQTAEDDGYVRVKRMTPEECRVLFNGRAGGGAIGWHRVANVFDHLGILSETPVERFKRENPGLSADELLEKALAR